MPAHLRDVAWPLLTPRLLIRPASAADVEGTWRIRRRPGVSDWLIAETADLEDYRQAFLDADRLSKTLAVERDGQLIGDLTVAVGDGWAQKEVQDRAVGVQAELGWVMDPAHGGQGLATEAVGAVLGMCFTGLGLRRVTAGCFADNTASWRLMKRVGMRREITTVRESLHRSGRWLDGLGYAMLADEWTQLQARGSGVTR
jgi:RimJ/RimL family protein N-acetyltransferase